MNQTQHYQLPQWEKSDPILMADFNAMTARLDALMPHFKHYTYVGADAFGSAAPCTVTFPQRPVLVLVFGPEQMMAFPGTIDQFKTNSLSGSNAAAYNTISWEGNTVSWYDGVAPSYQFNAKNTTYHVLALFIPVEDEE